MSPRRSSRARLTNPPTAPTNSSTSSISSGRAERSTRSHNKAGSPQQSGPRSQSLDDPEEGKLPPRRTRSGHEEVKEPVNQVPQDDEVEDDDEEEVTRCVCGQVDYPGLPGPTLDALKQQAKDAGSSVPVDIATDDTAGIFIQCDICKVWQHGGCVGILNDESAPENYFCEECRKDLHQLATTSSEQKFSRYKPIQAGASAATSPAPPTSSRSTRAKDNKPRASAEALAAKRRPTMNSYDEDEQLQRAIEESKKDGVLGPEDGSRRPKRSRSDSEE